jgi:hypothetical protein
MNDASQRDLAALVVPRWGRLVETDDRYEPYRMVGPDGATVEAISVFFQELLAAGKASSTVRSYGMDLLRWWRFLHAVDVGCNVVSSEAAVMLEGRRVCSVGRRRIQSRVNTRSLTDTPQLRSLIPKRCCVVSTTSTGTLVPVRS